MVFELFRITLIVSQYYNATFQCYYKVKFSVVFVCLFTGGGVPIPWYTGTDKEPFASPYQPLTVRLLMSPYLTNDQPGRSTRCPYPTPLSPKDQERPGKKYWSRKEGGEPPGGISLYVWFCYFTVLKEFFKEVIHTWYHQKGNEQQARYPSHLHSAPWKYVPVVVANNEWV